MSLQMRLKNVLSYSFAATLAGCATKPEPPPPPMPVEHNTLAGFQQEDAKFNSVISLPDFQTTTNRVELAVKSTLAAAHSALDQNARFPPSDVNFNNTLRALDDVNYGISLTENRLEIIKETSTDAALRDAATDQIKIIEAW